MTSRSLALQKSVPIPRSSMAIIKGKKGATISRLQQMPGIVSIQINTMALSLTVTALSKPALDSVLIEVRKLCAFSINKDRSFVPDFIIICYQSEHFSSPPSIKLHPFNLQDESSKLVFPSYVHIQGSKAACLWSPAENFSLKPIIIPSLTDWNPSGKNTRTSSVAVKLITPEDYQAVLRDCFSEISQAPQEMVVKVEVKLGKYLYLCERPQLDRIEGPLTLNLVDRMLNSSSKTLKATFCDSHTSKDISTLVDRLLASGYSKLPAIKHKVSIHVIDFRMFTKHSVSMSLPPDEAHTLLHSKHHFEPCHQALQCDSSTETHQTDEEAHRLWKFLRFPHRRGNVLGLNPGKQADIRLSVLTRETESSPSEELQEWVEDAWSSRSGDGLLKFDPDERFHIGSARYKEVHKFVLDDVVVRVAKTAACGENDIDFKWEVALRSRWFGANARDKKGLQLVSMDAAMEKLQDLFQEGNRLVQAMGRLHLFAQSRE